MLGALKKERPSSRRALSLLSDRLYSRPTDFIPYYHNITNSAPAPGWL